MTSDKQRYVCCCGEESTNPVDSGIATTKAQKDKAFKHIRKGFDSLSDYRPASAVIDDYHWYKRYLQMAEVVGSFSKDPSTKTGAVIVDCKQRVVSTGFNGFPRGIEDSDRRLNDRELKYKLILHAEENALMFAKEDLSGCTIFVHPLPPCQHCCLLIIQSGITTVVATKLTGELEERWGKSVSNSRELFEEVGVKVIEI